MDVESMSIRLDREPDGRWIARGSSDSASSASSDTPTGALRAFADKMERREAAEQLEHAVRALHDDAKRRGLSMTEEEIEAEIRAVRMDP